MRLRTLTALAAVPLAPLALGCEEAIELAGDGSEKPYVYNMSERTENRPYREGEPATIVSVIDGTLTVVATGHDFQDAGCSYMKRHLEELKVVTPSLVDDPGLLEAIESMVEVLCA